MFSFTVTYDLTALRTVAGEILLRNLLYAYENKNAFTALVICFKHRLVRGAKFGA